eukprot:5263659-Prymnesium_polylepis.2
MATISHQIARARPAPAGFAILPRAGGGIRWRPPQPRARPARPTRARGVRHRVAVDAGRAVAP